MSGGKKLRVTLIRGLTGKKPAHRDTVELVDTPQTRGMIGKVSYMLKVTEA